MISVDVRSRPESSRFPHFSRYELEGSLREAGISYLFLGEELGGRPDDPRVYRADGVVDYRKRRKSAALQDGLGRVKQELQTRTPALMCAEEDPIECHRFLMICPELLAAGIEPRHIRKSGRIESQRNAEDRLLRAHEFNAFAGPSLFPEDREEILETAYSSQAEKFAFRADPRSLGEW